MSVTAPSNPIGQTVSTSDANKIAVAKQKKVAPKWVRSFRDVGWRYVVAVIACLFAVFPFLFVVLGSFNADDTIASGSLLPKTFTLRHYKWLFNHPEAPYPLWMRNTYVVSLGVAFGTVFLCALGAFAFSRLRFRGRRPGLLTLLLCQMFPQILMITALYLISLNVHDVFPALGVTRHVWLVLIYLGGAMAGNVWLTKSFFDTVPMELDESAKVDGATHTQTFFRIVLPLATPILATIFIFAFISAFNEIALANVILGGESRRFTLTTGMNQFIASREQNWGRFAAGVVMASIPVLIIFRFAQRFLVSGLTSGSVKG
jgi:arabinogalactan oligomer / maltooligosaccharide transport system permease protein